MNNLKYGDLIDYHISPLNPADNSGESLILVTNYHYSGLKEKYFVNQELRLESYGTQASIKLGKIHITPRLLRRLADQMEQAEEKLSEKF